jgi:hypothetical protein
MRRMNPIVGWLLAAAALVAGWAAYGWRGLMLGATVIVFWLLLQFSHTMRVMKNAAGAPLGHVDSAVMLNAKLREGMPMVQVVALTRSLGRRVAQNADTYVWSDSGGCDVVVTFENGRCKSWLLNRPTEFRDAVLD